jgi:hypothetical protein
MPNAWRASHWPPPTGLIVSCNSPNQCWAEAVVGGRLTVAGAYDDLASGEVSLLAGARPSRSPPQAA